MKYDKTYEVVVHMAKAKMLMNDHKGNIEELSASQLVTMAKEELDELFEAIAAENHNHTHVIEEVADVLNFAIAAAHSAISEYRSRRK